MEHEQLDGWCERGILGLVLAILGFTPLAFGGVPQAGFDFFVVVQWLTLAIVAVWLLRFAINSKHRLLWPPVSWTVLAFMVYAVCDCQTRPVTHSYPCGDFSHHHCRCCGLRRVVRLLVRAAIDRRPRHHRGLGCRVRQSLFQRLFRRCAGLLGDIVGLDNL